jgi:hypothetical protein
MNIKKIISCMVFLFATFNVTVKCEEKNNKKSENVEKNKNNKKKKINLKIKTSLKNIEKSIDNLYKDTKKKVENLKNKTLKSNFKGFFKYTKKYPIRTICRVYFCCKFMNRICSFFNLNLLELWMIFGAIYG